MTVNGTIQFVDYVTSIDSMDAEINEPSFALVRWEATSRR